MFASSVSAGHGRRVLACLLCKDRLRLVTECATPCSVEVRDASGVIVRARNRAEFAVRSHEGALDEIWNALLRLEMQNEPSRFVDAARYGSHPLQSERLLKYLFLESENRWKSADFRASGKMWGFFVLQWE